MSVSWIYIFKKDKNKMLLIYLSGTILFVGLKNVEQVGLDLWESESDTVSDNKDELVKHQIQKTGLHFFKY